MRLPLLLPLLLGVTSARLNIAESCTTEYGTSLLKTIKTQKKSFTKIDTSTVLVEVVPVATVTPPAITSTISITETSTSWLSASVVTETFTASQIMVTTETISVIENYTRTTTKTSTETVSSTTILPVPSAFTAVSNRLSILPGEDFSTKDYGTLELRDTKDVKALPPIAPSNKSNNGNNRRTGGLFQAPKNIRAIPQYVASVVCHITTIRHLTTTTTATVGSTLTATAPADIIFITSTSHSTVTRTRVLAKSTVTITVPTTSLISTTLTSTTAITVTSTLTIFAPSNTYLSQCAPGRLFINTIGQNTGYVSFNKALVMHSLYPSDNSGYDCCAVCATSATCVAFGQHPNGACYYITTNGRCEDTQSWDMKFHSYNTTGSGYLIGNGPCSAPSTQLQSMQHAMS